MYKAVLFDLDGTLIDSLEDLADSANYALSRIGYSVHETEKYKYFVGDGVIKLMERVLPDGKKTAEEIDRLLKIYIDYYAKHSFDKTIPYDGVADMLMQLCKRGIKCAVVTNKPDAQSKIIVERFFGDKIFDAVTGNTKDYPPKPAPDIAIKTLKEIGVRPEEALFVGDTGVDMLTAKNTGCVPVGVTWGFRLKEELLDHGAAYIIDSPAELSMLISD